MASADGNSTSPAPSAGWAIKATILCSAILSSYVVGGLVPVLPHIAAAFRDTPGSDALVRFLISGVGISMIIGAPLAGLVADRFGRRRIIILSLLLYAICGTLGGLLDNLWGIVVSRLLFGIGAAGAGTLILSLLADMDEMTRRKWLGLATVTGTVAGIILYPLAGFLGEQNWRWPFLVHAIALGLIVIIWVGVPDRPRRVVSADTPRLSRKLPLTLIAISLVIGMLGAAGQLFVPFHLRNIGVLDASRIGLLMMPLSVAVAIISFGYARIRQRLSLRATFVLGMAIMTASLAAVGLSGSVPPFLVGIAIMGAALGILAPHFMAFAVASGAPEDAPRNMGLARGGYYAGPLVAQIALEPLVAAYQASAGILALGALGLFTTLLLLRGPQAAPQPA